MLHHVACFEVRSLQEKVDLHARLKIKRALDKDIQRVLGWTARFK